MKRIWFLSITLMIVFGMTMFAHATPIQWIDNGHYYEVVLIDNPTWFEARDAAVLRTYNGSNGYLATVTTTTEQNFLVSSLGGGSAIDSLWVGGYQDTSAPDYSENYGGWKWITGEPWNTGADAPHFSFNNNYWGTYSEEYLITWWGNGGLNDLYYAPDVAGSLSQGYIVEYNPIPEPSTLILLGAGLTGLAGMRKKNRHRDTKLHN